MRSGTWNVGSLYSAGSLKTVASELSKYNLGLVAVQNIILNKVDSQPADNDTFSMETEMLINNYGMLPI
jgi:GTPase involved in cell partitioning and DNA repair